MAGAGGGGWEAILGALAGGASYAQAGQTANVGKFNPINALTQSRIAQFLGAGGDLGSILLGKGKAGRKAAESQFGKGQRGVDFARFGKNFVRLPGQDEISKLAETQEEKVRLAQQKSFERLQQTPLFQGLIQGATGDFGPKFSLEGSLQTASNSALGGAAASGLNIADPLVQAKVLGGGAANFTLANRANARQASQSALALLSGGGSASSFRGPQNVGFNQNTALQGIFANLGINQQNAQFQNQSSGLQSGILGGVSSGLFEYAGSQSQQGNTN